jgi:hypothetical protein
LPDENQFARALFAPCSVALYFAMAFLVEE